MGALVTGAAAQSRAHYQTVKRVTQASAPAVRIAPTTLQANSTSIEIGEDRWSVRGFGLKSLIAQVFNVDERRVELTGAADEDSRWDVSMAIPADADEDAVEQALKTALEHKFGLTITPESREMDVYVLSAPNGPGAALHRHGHGRATLVAAGDDEESDDAGQITYSGRDCSGVLSSGAIEASAGTIGEFRRTLEPDVDRLLVDETNLKGSYDFKLAGYSNQDELFQKMQQELGIVVTPTQRKVTVLTVRPAEGEQDLRAAL